MKPIILITIGDPAGIGPEITLKALTDPKVKKNARCVVVGSRNVLEYASAVTGIRLPVNEISDPRNYREGVLNLIEAGEVDTGKLKPGEISGMCGKASYDYIAKSIELAMAGKGAAVATAPVNKESLKAGGVDFIGHTEIFGALTNTPDPLTMFEVSGLRVFFLTRHVSLRKACDMVTKERIVDYVRRCNQALKTLGAEEGVLAVAGLNPHSGEHGLFGSEEMNAVFPAVEQLKAEGFNVEGPVSADSVFYLALKGRYNGVLSLYHDQGHIAAKTFDFERTIAVTLGMPILRTSVDHGTAMDIAGKNIAGAVSMVEAISVAAKYSHVFSVTSEHKSERNV